MRSAPLKTLGGDRRFVLEILDATLFNQSLLDFQGNCNITTRRGRDSKENNMALSTYKTTDLEIVGCPIIDSILTQDETKDVVSMMMMADELGDNSSLHGFCTSTQMAGRNPQRRPRSPTLSPLGPQGQTHNHSTARDSNTPQDDNNASAQLLELCKTPTKVRDMNFINSMTSPSNSLIFYDDVNAMCEPAGARDPDVMNSGSARADGLDATKAHPHAALGIGDASDGSSSDGDTLAGNLVTTTDNNNVTKTAGDESEVKDSDPDRASNEESDGDEGEVDRVGSNGKNKPTDLASVIDQICAVQNALLRLDTKSAETNKTVKDLKTSLEFSQHEINLLKKENTELKRQLDSLETEDKSTQFQVNALDDKVDRLESFCKKKNSIMEGVPEMEGRKEDLVKTVGAVLDQLAIRDSINFDACYRMGPFNKNRVRPILVCFERQTDRDLVYGKRMELKFTCDFQKVWINEDLGALSKRKCGIIRLISREAQLQGVDCRTGKYVLHIDNKKIDHENLDDLPHQLHPTSLKQVQIDDPDRASNEESDGDEGEVDRVGSDGKNKPTDLASVIDQICAVQNALLRLDTKSAETNKTVKDLKTSLEFSQHEINLLKKENTELKRQLDSLETEDKRSQFQVNALDDKVDRLESFCKKKNSIMEGVPEMEGRKEDLVKTVGAVLDQLAIRDSINFDACYRMGPFNKNRVRLILVCFERQTDRDLVYGKRMELKFTRDFQKVWINEDLGALSKRKCGIIRLISREAQLQGVDCRTGKYVLHIDNKKIDHENLDDLPHQLHPTSLKQVQIDDPDRASNEESDGDEGEVDRVGSNGKNKPTDLASVIDQMCAVQNALL